MSDTIHPDERQALAGLLARLEAATEGSADLDREIEAYLFPQHRELIFRDKWNSPPRSRSLDAALTLVPEGRQWILDCINREDGSAWRYSAHVSDASDKSWWRPTPALALSIAALKARAAQ